MKVLGSSDESADARLNINPQPIFTLCNMLEGMKERIFLSIDDCLDKQFFLDIYYLFEGHFLQEFDRNV